MNSPSLRFLPLMTMLMAAGWHVTAGNARAETSQTHAAPPPATTAATTTPQADRADDAGAAAPSPAPAASRAPSPGLYAPDYCDMEITFPEAPHNREQCVPGSRDCYGLAAYTMVYDLRTSVDVSATCTPSTPEAFARYNQTVMKAALRGMIAERRLDHHEIQVREHGEMRSASLTGTGMTGLQEKIYTAQIWIGPHSVFTVQAELIGPTHAEADRAFSQILQSVRPHVRDGTPRPQTTLPDTPQDTP